MENATEYICNSMPFSAAWAYYGKVLYLLVRHRETAMYAVK